MDKKDYSTQLAEMLQEIQGAENPFMAMMMTAVKLMMEMEINGRLHAENVNAAKDVRDIEADTGSVIGIRFTERCTRMCRKCVREGTYRSSRRDGSVVTRH